MLKTPPLQIKPARLRIVSMVSGADHLMYLLAIKSFYRHLLGGEIVIMDDGTLTERHRALFRRHLGSPRFVRMDSIATAACPKGGCWERLLYILDLSRDSYVIQLDSDMLATGPIPEVLEAIRENRAFTLNTGSDQVISSLEDVASAARLPPSGPPHIQVLAERSLPHLPAGMGRRYVRGSAGFAGFACNDTNRQAVEAFSTAMQGLTGPRWAEWGTEQVASNYLVANSPGGVALPWPRYSCFFGDNPDEALASAAMLHFLGTWRWHEGTYLRLAKQVIAEMTRSTYVQPAVYMPRETARRVSA
ncbi:hypothetical protein [Sabulicella glaciei]|uniref:hypothetical protein n=1 Tax=Sabulicella glaciei TaxID=2984948 RepID=UPI00265AD938|nr:hypothetical protein [Roseococcus sp. MDT2-1-1]